MRVLLQGSAEHARLQAKEQMETLVTNALQYVFGPQFRFEIELSEHGGKSAAEFYVITDWEGTPVKTKPRGCPWRGSGGYHLSGTEGGDGGNLPTPTGRPFDPRRAGKACQWSM